MVRFPEPARRVLLPVLIALSIVPVTAFAVPQWNPLDGSVAGTPVGIALDPVNSDGTHTTLDVWVHGFWSETFYGPDQRMYTRVTVPGANSSFGIEGAPDLPTVALDLAVPQGIADVQLAGVTRLSMSSYSGVLLAPTYTPGIEGTPPAFARLEGVYGMSGTWPYAEGDATEQVGVRVGAILGKTVRLYLMKTNLQTHQLQAWSHVHVELSHSGTPQVSAELTKDCTKLAAARFANWSSASPYYPPNIHLYNADYLIVCPRAWVPAVTPLARQKATRGFLVQYVYTDTLLVQHDRVYNAITNWFDNTPPWHDHYALLVGDTDSIPTMPVTDPTGGTSSIQSDDPYASPNTIGLDGEIILVGRIAADSAADCSAQVAKILAYEDHPTVGAPYGKALLIAFDDTTYTNNQEKVRTTAYPLFPPLFTLAYGSDPTVRDATVRDTIDAGLGLVAYRGHGDNQMWWQWNTVPESFTNDTVATVANAPLAPVVWSIACRTGNVAGMTTDCLGEAWLRRTGNNGAVSFYGATTDSWTDANNVLNPSLFEAVYGKGLTIQSVAIRYAEAKMMARWGKWGQANAWMYLLLGDPQMKIRHAAPPTWHVHAPAAVGPCGSPPCEVDFTVYREDDLTPIAGVLASAYKWLLGPGPALQGARAASEQAEVFDNHYTGDDGRATLTISPTTPGWVYWAVQDDEGNAVLDSIQVLSGAGVGPRPEERVALRAQPSITAGATYLSFGARLREPATVRIFDVTGRCVRALPARSGQWGVHWDGRGASGESVAPGLYLVQLRSSQGDTGTRVVVIR